MDSIKLDHLFSHRIPTLTRQLERHLSRMSLARKPREPGAASARGDAPDAPDAPAAARGPSPRRTQVPAAVRRELFARDLVGDAIGEALCAVAEQMRSAEDGGAWAVGYFELVARRRLVDLARREAFRLAHHEAPRLDDEEGWTEPLSRAANDDADPEARAHAREELAATLAAMRALPEESQALLLALAEGLDYADLAPRFRTSEGALRVRAHGLRKRLRAAVRAEPDLPEAC